MCLTISSLVSFFIFYHITPNSSKRLMTITAIHKPVAIPNKKVFVSSFIIFSSPLIPKIYAFDLGFLMHMARFSRWFTRSFGSLYFLDFYIIWLATILGSLSRLARFNSWFSSTDGSLLTMVS